MRQIAAIVGEESETRIVGQRRIPKMAAWVVERIVTKDLSMRTKERREPICTIDRIRNALSMLAAFADIIDRNVVAEDFKLNGWESCIKVIDVWRDLGSLFKVLDSEIAPRVPSKIITLTLHESHPHVLVAESWQIKVSGEKLLKKEDGFSGSIRFVIAFIT